MGKTTRFAYTNPFPEDIIVQHMRRSVNNSLTFVKVGETYMITFDSTYYDASIIALSATTGMILKKDLHLMTD